MLEIPVKHRFVETKRQRVEMVEMLEMQVVELLVACQFTKGQVSETAYVGFGGAFCSLQRKLTMDDVAD